MNALAARIDRAFGKRAHPSHVIQGYVEADSDREDTEWFQNRESHEITWEDWGEHASAIFHFNPEAFVYYLPTILLLSLQRPDQRFSPVESLVFILCDRGAVHPLDEYTRRRFVGWSPSAYEVFREWLLSWKGNPLYETSLDDETIDCAVRAVDIFKSESARESG